MKGDSQESILSNNLLRSCTRQEVFKYIRKLHRIVRRQQKKLLKYKQKIQILKSSTKSKRRDVQNVAEKKDDSKEKTFLEEIREAAESAQNKTDFVYEPTSGLYYDQRTGYYYNAEYGLYYDGSSGCYYRYNQEKNEFEFHSRVQPEPGNADQVSVTSYLNNLLKQFSNLKINQLRENALGKLMSFSQSENTSFFILQASASRKAHHSNDKSHLNNGNSKRKRKKVATLHSPSPSRDNKAIKKDIEDGELSASSSNTDSHDVTVISDSNSCDVQCSYEDVAKKYPPSLRIIVQETNLPKLKIGTLFLITFKGGSLGREGSHDVIIPDVNVSKFHLKFTYDESESVYKCTDLGSRNGTTLNGKRMSNAKQESEPLSLVHGSVLMLSQTKLLCHVHSGNSTCGHCEPGLVIDQQSADKVVTLSHKAQLKVLQKRYGLENEKYVVTENKSDPSYSDRAAVRRGTVGSTNDFEKTEAASLETAIPSHNKGFKMLSKLGWSKGESLGKVQGILEPIDLVNNEGKTGLGCKQRTVSIPLTKKNQRKFESLTKTQQRYNQLKPANIFVESDDSISE